MSSEADPAPDRPRRERSDPAVRVLVVDDHLGFAGLLAAVLDAEPALHCVGLAGDGDQALDRTAELEPDVVLLDVQMPGRDGIAVTREVRARHADVVVVVMTASRDPIWRDRALEAGAAALVVKDGSLEALLDAIRGAARPG